MMTIVTSVLVSMISMSAYGSGWSGRQVTEHVTHRNDRTLLAVGLYGPWNNPDLCDSDEAIVLHPDVVSTSSYDETYALLLGAHLTGREINAFLSGCTMVGSKSFPVM